MKNPTTIPSPAGDIVAMTLISVRVPDTDIEALRLAAHTSELTVAHLVRSGIQMQLAALRRDPSFIKRVRAERAKLDKLVSDLESEVGPVPQQATADSASQEEATV